MRKTPKKLAVLLALSLTLSTLAPTHATVFGSTSSPIEKLIKLKEQSSESQTFPEEVSTDEPSTEEPTTEEPTTEEPTTEEPTTEEPTTEKMIQSTLSPTKSKVIVLDPGHGNIHTGCRLNGVKEEVVVLDIAKYCEKKLNQYGNVTVRMTRESGKCCNHKGLARCLINRNHLADRLKANFLVSFHINSDPSPYATGAMVLAAYKSGYHDSVRKETQALGKIVLKNLSSLGLKNLGLLLRSDSDGRYPNGKKIDYYSIVRNGVLSNVPGIIIEHGFVTNSSDRLNHFKTKAQRKQLGYADAQALIDYYKLEKNSFDGSFLTKGKSTYYVNKKGIKIVGWIKEGGKWYYMNPSNGKMKKGFLTLGKKTFYLDSTGAMTTDWFKVKSKTYFARGNGTVLKGKIYSLNGKKYYFKTNGSMKKGWVTYKKNRYYFNKSTGSMVHGWVKIGKHRYYFSSKTGKLKKKK
ncbi:MAG: N-acetylmuramoyl-L-alanine amidase [Eubacterium sp.]|nr:N-acetylmuramoyl-L-alanine amidase [Eubacterium sp.]